MSVINKIKCKASATLAGLSRSYLPAPAFIYMHLPKTAGSAIKQAIGNSGHADQFRLLPHTVGFEHLTGPEQRSESFVTIRRPLDWYLSLFNFKIHSESDKGYDGMTANDLGAFMADHIDFANGPDGIMRWNQPVEFKQHVRDIAETLYNSPSRHTVGFCTATFLYYSHRDWRAILQDADPHAQIRAMVPGQNCVTHVIRQEHLQDEVNQMLANRSFAIDLTKRVNQMAENKYHDLVDAETKAKIATLDRAMIANYYGDEAAS
ncbi:MAG: hypothetical protein ABF335_11585 [Alphaproteobacteria bacterium]